MLVRHQLELNAIELHLDLAPDLPRRACDPAQIEQVLLALIMNAIDAMPQGGNLWLEPVWLETARMSSIRSAMTDPEFLPTSCPTSSSHS